ncbi:DNA mismatch repair protein MLH3 [Entomortierella parvispora]|uniref:DNA mismatch repair protein MLH3 n=1 Tax=Entomortierella parvispora TaxID=205924 RepID=A0A9P3LT59_9FUNG|nr:DNA mismatch repair protein MLH3 [Entomortierella parvispora]
MAAIRPLAADVADELRASLVVHSLEQCALELVQNSLDANATVIEVKIDIGNHSLQVSDNGHGISSKDMDLIGTRYATSKCSTIDDLKRIKTYGFRGEAIAAIADMSLIDLVSRPRSQEHSFSAIFKGGDRLFCGMSSKQPRFGHGSTATVRDLFYKYPVRQRYWSDASAAKVDAELEKVKRALETLALVTPHVALTVIDMSKDVKILSCRKADSFLQRITMILGQGLASALTYVHSPADESHLYTFSGYISTVGHYTRLHQYIFLNNRPVRYDNLLKFMISIFQQSSFSKDSIRDGETEDTRRLREKHPVFVLTLTCPTSHYNICADPSKVTVEFEDEEPVFQIVRNTVIGFLERHHLLSRSAAMTLRHQTGVKKQKSKSSSRSLIPPYLVPELVTNSSSSRVKSSRPSKTRPADQCLRDNDSDGVVQSAGIDVEDDLEFELDYDWIASELHDDFANSEVDYSLSQESGLDNGGTGGPQTHVTFEATKRGYQRASLPHGKPSESLMGLSDSYTEPQSISKRGRTSRIWAKDVLRKWVNPVFSLPSREVSAIPTLSLDTSLNERPGSWPGSSSSSVAKRSSRFFTSAGDSSHFDARYIQLSKHSLQTSRVIAQVDLKFILCALSVELENPLAMSHSEPPRVTGEPSNNQTSESSTRTVLAVVDQHAADERVRVENLIRQMCVCSQMGSGTAYVVDSQERPVVGSTFSPLQGILHRVDSMSLLPPLPITLTRREWHSAQQFSEWLYRWGIVLTQRPPLPHQPSEDDGDSEMYEVDPLLVSRHFTSTQDDQDMEDTFCAGSANGDIPRPPSTESDFIQGYVTVLPRVVADRCVVDSSLTQDLIKDTISWGEESRHSRHSGNGLSTGLSLAPSEDDRNEWLRCIQGCPRAILDIVNSKACRGAIMFNDALSFQQCQDLVQNMARCAFPFQCAHGRPSIVPLTLFDREPPPRRRYHGRLQPSELSDRSQAHPLQRWSGRQEPFGSRADTPHGGSRVTYLDSAKWKAWKRE